MRSVKILLVLVFTVINWSLIGQDSRVESSVKAYQNKEFFMAMEGFNMALNYPAELSGTNEVKALYYRAMTRVYIYNTAIMNNDLDILEDYQDAYLDAYNDLSEGLSRDDGTWQKRIFAAMEDLHSGLLQISFQYVGAVDEMGKTSKSENVNAILAKAEQYAKAAIHINDNYMARDALGQVYAHTGDHTNAINEFLASIKLYMNVKPAEPDFYQGYVYYRLAKSYIIKNNPASALESILDGQAFLKQEKSRINGAGGKQQAGSSSISLFKQADKDLLTYELELYVNYPEISGRGITVFESKLSEDPDNYDLLIAYAKMLETIDYQRSLKLYEKARSIDPGSEIAWFNAGAVYYNRAREFYAQAGEEKDPAKYDVLMNAAKENFQRAWPLFEESYKLDPGNIITITALKNIALLLNKKEEYGKYSDLERALSGN